MGDPKQFRKKYNTPRHPWVRANIESEKIVTRDYGLAMKKARQFITHRHVMVNDQEISSPSYLVTLVDEGAVAFKQMSALVDVEHPERVILTKGEAKAQKVETAADAPKDHPKEAKAKKSETAEAPQGKTSEAQ